MLKAKSLSILMLLSVSFLPLRAADLLTKKALSLDVMKAMVAGVEAEAAKRNVHVSICIVDESGNLLFFQKADAAGLNTIQFAQRKARDAAFYRQPSKNAADSIKKGNLESLLYPEFFPNQGGLPIKVDGATIGAIAASGATSDVDEACAQAGIDAFFKPVQP